MKLICTMITFTLLFLAATVTDSIAQTIWTKDALNNPILTPGSSGSWDDNNISPFCVLFEDSTYHM